MQTALVLTVLGNDRPGLIENLSGVLNQYQGNWGESRMVDLAGQFAGLLEVSLPTAQVAAFELALQQLRESGLEITVARPVGDRQEIVSQQIINLEVLGPDAPGIVHNITERLSRLQVNIEDMLTEQRQAPMSAEKLFFARLELRLPENVKPAQVQDALEGLEDQLMVDFSFH